MHDVGGRLFQWTIILCILWAAQSAGAESTTVLLKYSIEPGVEMCPDETWVRQAVSARLGYNPFVSNASRQMEAHIRRVGSGLEGRLSVSSTDGKSLGKRTFSSATLDCWELVSSMELAMAIAIDPQYALRPSAEPTKPREETVVEKTQASPEPLPTPVPVLPIAPERSWEFRAMVGGIVSTGIAPHVAPGIAAQFEVRRGKFSLGLEGRLDFQSQLQVGEGVVKTNTSLATLLPCVRLKSVGLCAMVSAGAMQITGEISDIRRETSPLLLTGARASADIVLTQDFFIQPRVEAQYILSRTTLVSGESSVWVTAPVTFSGGLSFGMHFQ